MKCPSCNSENSDSAKFCKKCGTPLKESTISHQNMIDSMNNESKSNSTTIIIAVLVIIAVVLAGAFIYVNMHNSDASQNSNAHAGNSSSAKPVNQQQQQPQQQETTPQISSDSQSSSSASSNAQPSTSSMKIRGGSFSTGSAEEDKTYASIYVGSEYAGQSVIVQIYYSRDGNGLNNGNMVPATVHSDGYLEIASADAYHWYPDHAQINLYDSGSHLLDSVSVNLAPTSGTQTF